VVTKKKKKNLAQIMHTTFSTVTHIEHRYTWLHKNSKFMHHCYTQPKDRQNFESSNQRSKTNI